MSTLVTALAAVAIVVYVIGSQLRGQPLRGKRLIVLPIVLTVIGIVDLGKAPDPAASDVALLALGGAIAAAIGLGQGALMRLERRDGFLWGQMPIRSLWLWVALVLSHLVLIAIGHGLGDKLVAGSDSTLLLLGLNRLAQAVVVGARALSAGIPFAPEKDGSVFASGLLRSPTEPMSHHTDHDRVPSARHAAADLRDRLRG
jgi:hypothetical protein